jgi:protein-disulfide isomerase
MVWAATAEEANPPVPPTLNSLQHQLDELREGQRLLAEELREIKELLKGSASRKEVAPIPDTPAVITQNIRGEPFRGDPSARVAIVEYSDFNCSYCSRYSTNVYPQIARDFIASGKVRYLFRDLPDRADADSFVKAQAARCAGEQGKFWEMHDWLFQHPGPFSNDGQAIGEAAAGLGLDASLLKVCLQSGRYTAPIQRIALDAQRFGLHGTPSFLIGRLSDNGDVLWATRVVHGAETYEEFRTNLVEFIPGATK